MTKKDLADKIFKKFGHPVIKVELDPVQVYDAIDSARAKWIKWAVGQSTQETFFTMALSAGTTIYDLPAGVTEVIDYESDSGTGSINTLFTIDNYLFQQGYFNGLIPGQSGFGNTNYNLISYHIARDFLDTVRKYTPSKYNWKYHRYQNQLEIQPPPPSGNSLLYTTSEATFVIDSPGFVLLRTFMIEGSTNIRNWSSDSSDSSFYENDWIFDYAFAECKERIGYIRRKFESFASIGNTGIQMDGSDMISEGKEEKDALFERLKDEEAYEGWGISIGY